MSDMADYALDCAMNDCEEYWTWQDQGGNLREGYDKGFIDELGRDYSDTRMPDPRRYYSAPRGAGPCPRCKKPTELKEGKFGKFYGCTNFPICTGSRNKD